MNKICIYCGSKSGKSKIYIDEAKKLAIEIVRNNFELVYGGASIGVMGALADTVLELGGKVTGVIPKVIIDFEVAHKNLTKLIHVETMHERKLKMMNLSDVFVALPGGFGTMDELNEIITWKQIKIHQKPIFILNLNGYFDSYIEFIKKMVDEGFVSQEHFEFINICTTVEEIMIKLKKMKEK